MSKKSIWVIIPAYNEEKTLPEVIDAVQKEAIGPCIVVDDGSTDQTASIAKKKGVMVRSHSINLGQGAAIQTGFDYAKSHHIDVIVLLDADAQHDIEQAHVLLKPILDGECDVVNGSRFLGEKPNNMPWIRRMLVWLSRWAVLLVTGHWATDPFNGFRSLSKKAYQAMTITEYRYAHPFDIYMDIKRHNLRYQERPVTVSYTDYSLSKGQANYNVFHMIGKILWK